MWGADPVGATVGLLTIPPSKNPPTHHPEGSADHMALRTLSGMKTAQPASLLGQYVLIWSTNRPSQVPGRGQSRAEASAMAREPLS